ncbi:MAG: hypothetical protein V4631_00610 [Pseudomonadota bacterium]
MVRIILGAVGGFFSWLIMWVGVEMALSAMWPASYGAHQLAFQEAISNGGQFTADSTLLLAHIAIGAIVSVAAGLVAALIARGNKRALLALALLLLAMGVMKAVMSWPYVPIWYHLIFTGMLFPLTIVGGKLRPAA